MYHLSRSLYRELAPILPATRGPDDRHRLLEACESTLTRLATDPDYFAHPERQLFRAVRTLFALGDQRRVCRVIEVRLVAARAKIEHERALMRRDCGAFTRRGARCRREALEGGKYCPSHRHLEPVADPVPA
jgi:hypothetical protein